MKGFVKAGGVEGRDACAADLDDDDGCDCDCRCESPCACVGKGFRDAVDEKGFLNGRGDGDSGSDGDWYTSASRSA